MSSYEIDDRWDGSGSYAYKDPVRCEWLIEAGQKQGSRCNLRAVNVYGDYWYCDRHYGIAQDDEREHLNVACRPKKPSAEPEPEPEDDLEKPDELEFDEDAFIEHMLDDGRNSVKGLVTEILQAQKLFFAWRGIEVPCSNCKGSGIERDKSTCNTCGGTGDANRSGLMELTLTPLETCLDVDVVREVLATVADALDRPYTSEALTSALTHWHSLSKGHDGKGGRYAAFQKVGKALAALLRSCALDVRQVPKLVTAEKVFGLTLKVTREEYEAVKELACLKGQTMSGIVRELIRVEARKVLGAHWRACVARE